MLRFVSKLEPHRIAALAIGIAAFLLIAFLDTPLRHQGGAARPAFAAAATALMAIWWLTETIPINLTACLPLLLFPLFGVLEGSFGARLVKTGSSYVDPYIFLFMGGMGIAAAMQAWNLHRRIALRIMQFVGASPRRLLLGLLLATALISLWISNTATAAMMMPIGLAVIHECEARAGRRLAHYGAAVMLAIAYAANIGGVGTKIGTASNALFVQQMASMGTEVSFRQFSAVGLPFVALMIPLAWWLLWRIGRADRDIPELGAKAISEEVERLGPIRSGQLQVLAVFATAAALWMLGQPLTAWLKSTLELPWIKTAHVEGGVAMAAALLLMALRAEGRPVLRPSDLRTQPWGTLLLLGGSFALAEGIQASGLSAYAGSELRALSGIAPFWQVLLACLATVALSAVASNTATTAVMLGVLRSAVSPEVVGTVLFAATIAASCDFALPAGTPPNAIVFASGYLTVRRMASAGVLLDLVAALLASVWCWAVVRLVIPG